MKYTLHWKTKGEKENENSHNIYELPLDTLKMAVDAANGKAKDREHWICENGKRIYPEVK